MLANPLDAVAAGGSFASKLAPTTGLPRGERGDRRDSLVGADLVRESLSEQGVTGLWGAAGRGGNPAAAVPVLGFRGQGPLLREQGCLLPNTTKKPGVVPGFFQLRYSTGRRRCT